MRPTLHSPAFLGDRHQKLLIPHPEFLARPARMRPVEVLSVCKSPTCRTQEFDVPDHRVWSNQDIPDALRVFRARAHTRTLGGNVRAKSSYRPGEERKGNWTSTADVWLSNRQFDREAAISLQRR